jgi:hypothetical protein
VRPLCYLDLTLVSVKAVFNVGRTVCQRVSNDMKGRNISLNASQGGIWLLRVALLVPGDSMSPAKRFGSRIARAFDSFLAVVSRSARVAIDSPSTAALD